MLQLLQLADYTQITKDSFAFSFNGFVALFVLILVAAGASGYRVGFVRLLVTIASVLLSLVLTFLMAPAVHSFLQESMATSLKMTAEKYVGEELDFAAVEHFYGVKRSYSDERFDLYNRAGLSPELANTEGTIAPYLDTLSDEQQVDFIDSLTVPAKFKDAMKENVKISNYDGKPVSSFSQHLAVAYATMASWGIVYSIVYLIIQLVVTLILTATGLVKKIPKFNTINQVGGLLLGLVFSVGIMWIIFMIVLALAHTIPGNDWLATIQKDPLMRILYDWDIFTNYIQIHKFF